MRRTLLVAVGVMATALFAGVLRLAFAQSEDPRTTEVRRLMYPIGAQIAGTGRLPGAGQPPNVFHSIWTTSDDLDAVLRHYEKLLKLYHPETTRQITGMMPGQAVSENFKGHGWYCQDDSTTQPAGNDARAVTVRVISSYAARSAWTLVVSRAKGEERTHLVLTYQAW